MKLKMRSMAVRRKDTSGEIRKTQTAENVRVECAVEKAFYPSLIQVLTFCFYSDKT